MLRRGLPALTGLMVFIFVFSTYCRAGGDYPGAVREIEAMLEDAYSSYLSGEPRKAKSIVSGAYFDVFEGKGLESAVGAASEREKTGIEVSFARISGQISSGDEPVAVRASIDGLLVRLRLAAAALEKESGLDGATLLTKAFLIIVREGLEAILIISALVAYLIKTGKGDMVRVVYAGGGAAVLASLAFAALFHSVLSASGAGREALEGAAMLLAAVVLFYVSYWLISRSQAEKWQKYVKSTVEGALSRGNQYALGLAAFLAVFREGAETVLFYQALASEARDALPYLLGGLSLGLAALTGVFFAFRHGISRMPLRPFFAVTSMILYYLAFTFAGKGVLELQEAGVLASTPLDIPHVEFFGVYPSMEGVFLQLILAAAMAFAVVHGVFTKFALKARGGI